MTEPLTITVLDERTKEELQPPCEACRLPQDVACGKPAAWLARFRCPGCANAKRALTCDEHLQALLTGQTCCARCDSPLDLLSSERIR